MKSNLKLSSIFLVVILLVMMFSACTDDTGVTIYGSIGSLEKSDIKIQVNTDTKEESDSETEVETSATEKVESKSVTEYLLNINSKKFHLLTCKSGQKTKEVNRTYHTGTREEVIAKGYTPCKACNP